MRYLLRKVVFYLIAAWAAITLNFLLPRLLPGNPVDILIGQDVDQIDRARIIAELGLDKPLWEQYLAFLNGALHGNLGKSFVYLDQAKQPA